MRAHVSLLPLLLALPLCAQNSGASHDPGDHPPIPRVFDFENENGGALPPGWGGGPAGTVHADNTVAHSGKWSVRLARSAESTGSFSELGRSAPVDFAGKQIELRGYLRIDKVEQYAGLWLREDGDEGRMISIDNMQGQNVRGTRDWAEYSVKLPLDSKATALAFGALLGGTGTVWVDDLQLLVDGVPVADAPRAANKALTVLDRDKEFDGGSRIKLDRLSAVQIDNLVMLCRVWGFLKYHDPVVTAGERQWDYDLFRIMPEVLAAKNHDDANAAMVRWVDGLGPASHSEFHARLNSADLEFGPDLGWIADAKTLGRPLSERLQAVYRNRSTGSQFYVSLAPGVLNPRFDHERAYPNITFPDAGFQLLALYRFWNILQYWSPNRAVAGENWPEVLREFIPKVALAKNKDEYQLAMMAFSARVHDSHTNLWSSLKVRPPVGDCRLPVTVRFVEGKLVVTGYDSTTLGPASGLTVGDVVESMDGQPVEELIKEWAPLYAGSNEAARQRDMAGSITNGSCGAAKVSVLRADGTATLEPVRVPAASLHAVTTDDLPGPTFRLLSKDVAYIKLSSIKAADVAKDIEQAQGTKGLIIDIRNYPSEFVVFALGDLLVDHVTAFARFTNADLANPGAFHWYNTAALSPAMPHYPGKVVILVDEVSQSQAEYTAMAFRAAPNAVVVGSMTAGADGNVSEVPLPGGLSSMISGIGVFYPDKQLTQRVGIVPDVEARPTIAGIRAGRDDVLEAGIEQILGKGVPMPEIEKTAGP